MVVRDGAPPFLERIASLARYFTGAGVGCDIVVHTESEWRALARSGNAAGAKLALEGLRAVSALLATSDRLKPSSTRAPSSPI